MLCRTGGQFIADRRIPILKGRWAQAMTPSSSGCGAPRGRNLYIPGVTNGTTSIRHRLAGDRFVRPYLVDRQARGVLGGGTRPWTAAERASPRLREVPRSSALRLAEMKASVRGRKRTPCAKAVEILNFLAPMLSRINFVA